jgi:hypothetical protein
MDIEQQGAQGETPATPESSAQSNAPVIASPEDRLSLSPEQRDSLLFGEVKDDSTGKTAEEVKETQVDASAESETVGDEASDEASDEPGEDTSPAAGDKILPNRISTKQFDEREQEAIALKYELAKQGIKISLPEACARIDAKYGVQSEPIHQQQATDPSPDPIEVMKQEAKALEDKLSEFDDGLITPEFRRLQAEYAEKLADIRAAKLEAKFDAQRLQDSIAQREALEQAERRSAREANKAEVLKEYPTANDAKSPLGKEITLLYSEISSDPNHPLRAEMAKDSFPAFLAQKAVESKTAELKAVGLTDAQVDAVLKGKPMPKEQVKVEAKTGAKPVPRTVLVTQAGSKSAPEPAPPMSPREALERARLDPKFRDSVLGFGGGIMIR